MHFIKYRHQQTARSIFNLPSDVGFNTGDKDRLSNQVDAEAWTQAGEQEEGGKAAGRLRWGVFWRQTGTLEYAGPGKGHLLGRVGEGFDKSLWHMSRYIQHHNYVCAVLLLSPSWIWIKSCIWNCSLFVEFCITLYVKCYVGNFICWCAFKWSSAERHPSLSNVDGSRDKLCVITAMIKLWFVLFFGAIQINVTSVFGSGTLGRAKDFSVRVRRS